MTARHNDMKSGTKNISLQSAFFALLGVVIFAWMMVIYSAEGNLLGYEPLNYYADNSIDISFNNSLSRTELALSQNTFAQANVVAPSTNVLVDTKVVTEVLSVTPKEKGVWVWDSPDKTTEEHMMFLIKQIAANKFTAIYISLDDRLSLLALPDTSERKIKISKYDDSLLQFLKLAHAEGMAVDAEAGASDWAKSEYQYKAKAILDFAKQFNARHADKLRGVQFDVEPYLLPEYEANKKAVLTDYAYFVDETSREAADSKLKLTFVIPHFFDKGAAWTPAVTVNDHSAHTFTHVLRSLSRLPDTAIIIMAYRNYAQGEGGVIELAKSELEEASDMKTGNTRIIIAQEAGNVLPEYVTYFHTSRVYMESQTTMMDKAFMAYRVFGGIAINYIDPFLALPK